MKAVELFQSPLTTGKGKKRKKLPKQPDPWFFAWAGPGSFTVPMDTGGEGDGGGVSESVIEHNEKDMPNRIFLAKSYYMDRANSPRDTVYDVKQFLSLDDEKVAQVRLIGQVNDRLKSSYWLFSPNAKKFPNAREFKTEVSRNSLFNHRKLKWFTTNRLIELGLLPPLVHNAN